MDQLATIHINKESHKFSVAHFTVFSADRRERLHGHNFAVAAKLVAPVDDNGLTADYGVFKEQIGQLCEALDEYTLIPGDSPHLEIETSGAYYRVRHGADELHFLRQDTLLLPISNTTVEALSRYLLERLVKDSEFLRRHDIREIEIQVSSGPGQRGACIWRR